MTDVVMPQMGESIVEGTLTRWLKKAGEHVERDEPLFEISTDKVDTEIPSPGGGHASRRSWSRGHDRGDQRGGGRLVTGGRPQRGGRRLKPQQAAQPAAARARASRKPPRSRAAAAAPSRAAVRRPAGRNLQPTQRAGARTAPS